MKTRLGWLALGMLAASCASQDEVADLDQVDSGIDSALYYDDGSGGGGGGGSTCSTACGGACAAADACWGTGDSCTYGACARPAAGVDKDLDGIPDQLEYDLAQRYF